MPTTNATTDLGEAESFLTGSTQIYDPTYLVANFNWKQDRKVLLCDLCPYRLDWHDIKPRLSKFAYKSVVHSSYRSPQKPTLR